jgi:hypothetical protein
VDRSQEDGKQLTKEDLIDNLLDFLGAPDEDLTKASKKKSTKKTSTKKTRGPAKKKTTRSKGKKEEEENDDEEEEAEEEDEPPDYSVVNEAKKGEMPSDVALQQWVRAYVACFDMDSATTTHAIATASEKFGVDMTSKKSRIKEILTVEM